MAEQIDARVSILGQEAIVIGRGLTDRIAQETVAQVPASFYVIFTDAHLEAAGHLAPLQAAFRRHAPAASTVLTHVVPPGEAHKTRATKAAMEDWLLAQQCTRDSCFVALGGGVIGDMIGFLAATFMRGVPVVQVPTTLLAMVDSAVGGKTAIDVPAGKNLIGAFHQPARIFIDQAYLNTLPRRQFSNGLAEVIKTAAIWDANDFQLLENTVEGLLSKYTDEHALPIWEDADAAEVTQLITSSVRIKAHVVTSDEKEGGLRGILNFGHSIGHAIEAAVFPQLLHGEAVAIGMVLEMELARHLGHLPQVAVGRLLRLLQTANLPTSMADPLFRRHVTCAVPTPAQLLTRMAVDKKNVGTSKRIVLLNAIGSTYRQQATPVTDTAILWVLSPDAQLRPLGPTALKSQVTVRVPGSKSISNRALLLAALGQGPCRIRGLLHSDDVQVMLSALQALMGIRYRWSTSDDVAEMADHFLEIEGAAGAFTGVVDAPIYLGNAGTASRFLTTVVTLIQSHAAADGSQAETLQGARTILTGNHRMKIRPIGPLVDALRANGSEIAYLEKEGCLPIAVAAQQGLKGGVIELAASISSQYVSSILMAAPYAAEDVHLKLVGGHVISQPYIDMTLAMMAQFGIEVDRVAPNEYRIPRGVYANPAVYDVEGDASSATYPLALAAMTGTEVTVANVGHASVQGDAAFARLVLQPMGCDVEQTATTTRVRGPAQLTLLPKIDMETMTDAFMTAAVLVGRVPVARASTSDLDASDFDASTVALDAAAAAAAAADREVGMNIYGIANQRVKECNRIQAMRIEMAKFGIRCEEHDDGLIVYPSAAPLHAPTSVVDTHDDHRIAMSLSLLALGVGASFLDQRCVAKTWPDWWGTLARDFGVELAGATLVPPPGAASAAVGGGGDRGDTAPTGLAIRPPPAAKTMSACNIVLIGFRGAGKTHLMDVAVRVLGMPAIDLDHELERRIGQPIRDLVNEQGWAAFREQEQRVLQDVLASTQGTLISTGGGIVETEGCRKLLRDATNCVMIHVSRDFKHIAAYLAGESHRPSYAEDIATVWARRRPLYDALAHYHFASASGMRGKEDWALVDAAFVRLLTRIRHPQTHPLDGFRLLRRSVFVSLTADVASLIDEMDTIGQGAQALELRADLLLDWAQVDPADVTKEVDYVRRQIALLRIYSSKAIIFTVRSKAQGGRFPDHRRELQYALAQLALQAGCEFVDVEHGEKPEWHARLIALRQQYPSSRLIASYHDTAGALAWTETPLAAATATAAASAGPTTFGAVYDQLEAVGDVVKLIGVAETVEDAMSCRLFAQQHTGPTYKPLIAITMYGPGQISRVLNTFLTPITHPLLETAAPGQMSLEQIHAAAAALGLVQPEKLFLWGTPIANSASPAAHNAGFDAFGMSWMRYGRCETDDVAVVLETLKRPDCAGGNLTIPLKEALLPLRESLRLTLTPEAEQLGAINTLARLPDGGWLGDNTDWQGIRACLQRELNRVEAHARHASALVIGGGGTAKAAAFALRQMGVAHLALWNRTAARIAPLADQFKATVVAQLAFPVASLQPTARWTKPPLIIVSTIPASAQDALDLTKLFPSESGAETSQACFLVEMAMNPRQTRLLQSARAQGWHVVEGIDVLVEQGVRGWERWTHMPAPESVMRQAAYTYYDQQFPEA